MLWNLQAHADKNIWKPLHFGNSFCYILVIGGTGEGKQHLGSDGKIPNKQVAIPEIQSGYETPPNPCPVNAKTDGEYMEAIRFIVVEIIFWY